MTKQVGVKLNLASEEEVRNKIMGPYLKALGLNIEDVECEKTLKLKLGKTTHDKKSTNVRLDILCKKGNKNLFVFELKRDSKQIDQEDIDQGISYARLLHPIAPFMIVSNGIDTQVFDTITKEKLNGKKIKESKFVKNNFEITIQNDISLRYEALKYFIGYSNENLKTFCDLQNEKELSSLLGNKEKLNVKYVPDLFIERNCLKQKFEEFKNTNTNTFLILGNSGVGKTNSMCNFVKTTSSDNLVLFYRGSFLSKHLFQKIRGDFDWVFSSSLKEVEVFRNLNNLAGDKGKKVYIFIDAIDEIPLKNRALDINEICDVIEKFENIKLCITCKTHSLDEFFEIHGEETALCRQTKGSTFNLEKFNDNELCNVILKYKKVFNLNGIFSEELKEYCRLGFNLKIIGELFNNKSVPKCIDVDKITRKYIESKAKIANIKKSELINVFSKIAELMCNETNENINKVKESKLVEIIGKDINENFFTYNLLERENDENYRTYISFYYTKLADFVIALYVYGLDILSGREFEEAINKMKSNSHGISSLLWFEEYATENQKKIFIKIKKQEGLYLLKKYEKILNNYFPKIKEKFEPFTTNEIGIAIDNLNSPFIYAYGFYEKFEAKKKVILMDLPVQNNWFRQGIKNIYFFNWKQSIQYKNQLFKFDKKELSLSIEKNIYKQLKKIIENQDLNEEENINLSKEKLINLVYFYGKKIGYNHKVNNPLVDYNIILPLDLNKLEYDVKYNIFQEYYKNQQLKEYTKIKISEGINSFQINDEIFDYKNIELKAKEALNNKDEISRDFNSQSVLILNEINVLKKKGIQIINKGIFPFADITAENAFKNSTNNGLSHMSYNIMYNYFSKEKNQEYFYNLFHFYFKEYLSLVENNFNFLKDHFDFYKNFPYKIRFKMGKKQDDLIYHYSIYKSKKEEILIESDFREKISDSYLKDQNYIFTQSGIPLNFYCSDESKINKDINTSKANRCCIIRGLVYEQLSEDFDNIKELFKNEFFQL